MVVGTKLPVRVGMEARDHRAVMESFAENAVIRSHGRGSNNVGNEAATRNE